MRSNLSLRLCLVRGSGSGIVAIYVYIDLPARCAFAEKFNFSTTGTSKKLTGEPREIRLISNTRKEIAPSARCDSRTSCELGGEGEGVQGEGTKGPPHG